MGVIQMLLAMVFGGGRNVLAETAQIFGENAEAAAIRDIALRNAALAQFSSEFAIGRRGSFHRLMDGLNRVPRPAMALGTIGLFVAAMVDPIWFAARMQGIALVPEALWWLLGAIVSFYFGARYQVKNHEYQASLAGLVGRAHAVIASQAELRHREPSAGGFETDPNAALEDWRALRGP